MGAEVDYELIKHGLFSDLVGHVNVKIKTMSSPLKPIDLTSRGKFLGVDVVASCTDGGMLELYNEHFKKQFEELLSASYPGSY